MPVTLASTQNPAGGMAVDAAGNVYFTDGQPGNSQSLKKWTVANNSVTILVSNGPVELQSVAMNGSGTAYVGESQNGIYTWSAPATSFTLFDFINASFTGDLALDVNGNLFFTENGSGVIEYESSGGNALDGTPALQSPKCLALDVADNVYVIASYGNSGPGIYEWLAANSSLTRLVTIGDTTAGVAVDGAGNVYYTDVQDNVWKWSPATPTYGSMVVAQDNGAGPYKVAVDTAGNIYFTEDGGKVIKELPYAFVDPTPKIESSAAGSDSLPPVLPTTENLSPPFAPTSSQLWLTVNSVCNGVIGFSFSTNNFSTNRTAQITVLGQSIPITQSGAKIMPVITWSNPPPITYGTPLSTNNQLNATANVAGSFNYTPAPGAILTAGTHTLSAVFTPYDTNDYTKVTNTVSLMVLQATPVITWGNPSLISYITPLSSVQLNATANVRGNFAYNPSYGTVLPVGTNTLRVLFAPTDANDYTSVSASVTVVVSSATQFLPVYQVTQAGATFAQAMSLANLLNIPTNSLVWSNGQVSFIDPSNFMAVPYILMTNTSDPVISNLIAGTQNPYPGIPITVKAIDFATLTNLPVFSTNAALNSISNALASVGLTPQFATPLFGHGVLFAFMTNSDGTVTSASQDLDTMVNYQFSILNGANSYHLIGAGAHVQANYGPTGNLTRLLYAAPRLTPGSSVQIISPTEASNRVASLLPTNAQISLQLIYQAPSFFPRPFWPPCSNCPPATWNPSNLIPYYAYSGILNMTNLAIGSNNQLITETHMIPATDDTNYVPSISLSASQVGTQIVASVSASGGAAPYICQWSGSATGISSNNGASLTYTPITRVGLPPLAIAFITSNASVNVLWPYPSTGFVLESTTNLAPAVWSQVSNVQTNAGTNGFNLATIQATGKSLFLRLRLVSQTLPATETVGVTVTDANGVSVHANETLAVQAQPNPISPSAPGDPPSFATESPFLGTPWDDAGFSGETSGWLATMNGFAAETFCHVSVNAQPGDFIEPPISGVVFPLYPAKPWPPEYPADYGSAGSIICCADVLNQGVNSANLVFYTGHGNIGLISFTWPGGDFPTSVDDFNGFILGGPSEVGFPFNDTGEIQIKYFFDLPNLQFYPNMQNSWGNFPAPWQLGQLGAHNLDWMVFEACDTLCYNKNSINGFPTPDTNPQDYNIYNTLGPNFSGLHMLLGFNTSAVGAVGTAESFAFWLHFPGFQIPLDWFLATEQTQPATIPANVQNLPPGVPVGSPIVPAAMGPISANGIADFWDPFVPVPPILTMGPSIPPSMIQGWWYAWVSLGQ